MMESQSCVLGKRIRFLRKNAQLKQNELADLLDISYSSISQYESGQRTPNDNIKIKIANFFGVSLDYLLGNTLNQSANLYIQQPLSKYQQDLLDAISCLTDDDFKKVLEYAKLLSIKYKETI